MPKRHNPSHTLLGIPGAKKGEKGEENSEENGDEKDVSVDEEQGGSTMFGMGNRRSSGPLGGRRPSGKGVRQTLMGLGSVRLLNEPSENADRPFEPEDGDDKPKAAKPKVGSRSGGKRDVRSTMTGLPGVEVGDKKKSGRPKLPGRGGKKGSAAARSTMMGMPAITDDSSKKPKLSTDKLSLKSPGKAGSGKKKENSEPTVSISDDHIQKARKLAKKFDKPQQEEQSAEAGGEDEFDPLAGFAGVTEPKVSSLMDEEVEDLSAQVFGDGFAFGDEELDFEEDEEDDFDFEFASVPSQPSGQAGTGDIPEEDVHHDIEAAEAALADMMTDLEDVMPDENEAAEALGFDEDKAAAALAEEKRTPEPPSEADPDGPTIADANVKEMMAEVRAEKAPPVPKESPAPAAPTTQAKPAKPKKAKPAAAPRKAPASSAGSGFGLGGVFAVLGGLASVAWLFIPVEGATVVSAIASLDVASQVLVVFSVVAAILAIVTALMKLPGGSKGLVLGVLGIGLGALSFSAPVLTEPLNFPVYAAAGLFVLAGVFYAFTGKKT